MPLQICINDTEVIVRVNNMGTAGEILQDIANFLGVKELESVAEFPIEFQHFEDVFQKMENLRSTRHKMSADMADSSQMIKALVIKAEDARILANMKGMRSAYKELYLMNQELLGEYAKRSNNHEELMAALKEVNRYISQASKLRVGEAKTRTISECRNALKSKNIGALVQIMRTGKKYSA